MNPSEGQTVTDVPLVRESFLAANVCNGVYGANGIHEVRLHTHGLLNGEKQQDLPYLRARFDEHIAAESTVALGQVRSTSAVPSSLAPFQVLEEHRVHYPQSVTDALGSLYAEYNCAFAGLVKANREWETDYQYAMDPDGMPVNYFAQIDMVGLPPGFLAEAEHMDPEMVKMVLRERIYEFENSLAMYNLLIGAFPRDGGESAFARRYNASLNALREQHGKPIALLAITKDKHQAMLATEFGKMGGSPLTDAETKQLSGFDTFFGPEEFEAHVRSNDGKSEYLLYVRSSDPIKKIKDPKMVVEGSLLLNADMRRIIKANALTFNIDNPAAPFGRRINDTKEYMPIVGMGLEVTKLEQLLNPALIQHFMRGKGLEKFGGPRLDAEFAKYLHSQGLPAGLDTELRAKPMKGAYGCYGHVSGALSDREFRGALRKGLEVRGSYIIQPERRSPEVVNEIDGVKYEYMDRNLITFVGGKPQFLGGFRAHMPIDSVEAANGRNHGSKCTVWSEVEG
jgi:hypothetical protein